MELNLTWDLFILVFFLIIVAYSVMIGKDQTIKVILSSYIAILTSDALGNLAQRVITGSSAVNQVVNIPSESKLIILLKIAIFVFLTVALTTRGAFEVVVSEEKSAPMRLMMLVSYGVLSAGLIVSTILVYVSGASLISATSFFSNNSLQEIASSSRLVQLMTNNYAVWFALPAVAFVVSSLFGRED